MKKTGRIKTLRGFVNVASEGSISDASGINWANRIFNDERIGFGWVVIDFALMPSPTLAMPRANAVGLWTINPDRLGAAQLLQMITNTASSVNNQCIGVIRAPYTSSQNTVLDPDHIVVDTLTIVAESDDAVPYLITLEEYEISDYEEIVQRVKEVAQNIEDAA
jgi:hypothetical protein|tara:strand:+ start:1053 stop:1544 length:492 start_codon:yes stop_codon:yes gene_type:complete